jgi:hypothetical protein
VDVRGDALTTPAHVAMTMQSPLSPAADMPPDELWTAMCHKPTSASIRSTLD